MFRRFALLANSENLEKLKACPTALTLYIGIVAPYSKPKTFPGIAFGTYIELACRNQDFI
ncbi:MAG: hypothetical protein QXJ07_02360 [Candidatus Bathyarchaeia archaeon]